MATEQKYDTIKDYLDHLIARRETSCVEFKYGKGGLPHKEFWPSYSSFANTDGGVIIIGVKEKNGNFYPEGLSAKTVELEGNERVDETKAHKALREAFVNLCVHASYQSDSKLLILKYPNRIVFSNPGIMLVSKEQYFSGGESICRNPALQTMFSMIGAVEKAGSGADTIVQGWDDAKFGTPVISEKSEPNKVELTLPIISDGDSNGDSNRDNENDKENLNDHVNTDDDPVNDLVNRKHDPVNRENDLVKNLLAVYNAVEGNPEATYTELADQLNISIATVKRNLQKLKEQNYVKREGSDKTGKWVILK